MSLFRPAIDRLQGYVPGEQPRDDGWVKLNTNENPYPPSPRVAEAIAAAAAGRLNLYPDPLATEFRQVVADLFELDPDWVLPGNGSDENLTVLIRSFVDAGQPIAGPYPSYVLYPTLAELQGARWSPFRLRADWSIDLDEAAPVVAGSKLVLVPNPNSPSGNRFADEDLRALVPEQGLLVLDEAYGDFADAPHAGELLHDHPGQRIVITRTLSKSYSLAGIRLGFALAHPDLIAGMRKVKDSYNCDTLSLAAGVAAVRDQDWMRANVERIRATRIRLTAGLVERGFEVVPSQANFVWATHPDRGHRTWFEELKRQRILVRYIEYADGPGEAVDGLRITVGTDEEIDRLLAALGR